LIRDHGRARKQAFCGIALAVLLLFVLADGAAPQTRSSPESQAPQPYRMSVDVNLVVLDATVRDQKGRPASDLTERDFEVYEDGVRQSIRLFRHDDIPVTVGLVVDHSGSMREKLTNVIAAARTFVASSSSQDQMFVVNFNEKVTLGLPPAIPLTNRPDELAKAISNTPAAGMTALYDAVVEGRKGLRAGGPDKKVLIVISDGADNASTNKLDDVLKMAAQSNVLVYTIGIFEAEDPDRNPDVLRRLAGGTGGEAFFPRELPEVVAICERIARDIRNQYTIGYFSSNAERTNAYRTIHVVAHPTGKGKLIVRTRPGYIAGGESRPVKDDRAK
jgi:Ca-activated chloride channel family protein